jgi:hypothetical protein
MQHPLGAVNVNAGAVHAGQQRGPLS